MKKLPKLPNPGSVFQAKYTADQMRKYARCAIAGVEADFDAYKEGSEEAFHAVVEQKQNLEKIARQMESTIQSQQALIVDLRERVKA
jgi:hypothetical protein